VSPVTALTATAALSSDDDFFERDGLAVMILGVGRRSCESGRERGAGQKPSFHEILPRDALAGVAWGEWSSLAWYLKNLLFGWKAIRLAND
jgi:hypothetical protein